MSTSYKPHRPLPTIVCGVAPQALSKAPKAGSPPAKEWRVPHLLGLLILLAVVLLFAGRVYFFGWN